MKRRARLIPPPLHRAVGRKARPTSDQPHVMLGGSGFTPDRTRYPRHTESAPAVPRTPLHRNVGRKGPDDRWCRTVWVTGEAEQGAIFRSVKGERRTGSVGPFDLN